jgi:acetyl esterase/lipase
MHARTVFVGAALTLILGLGSSRVLAQSREVETQRGIEYAEHDGIKLLGDLYTPTAPGKYPALIAAHGGAFQVGSSNLYRFWGPYLAARGYVFFAVNYRLAAERQKTFPEAIQDVRAAVQFVRGRGEAIKVDPARIGLIGDSAGAYLSAMVALAGEQPPFASAYKADRFAAVPTDVKVCVGIYGVYDLTAAWQEELVARPYDRVGDKFLGASLIENRRLYFDASPLSYVTMRRKIARPAVAGEPHQPAFLIAWGTEDNTTNPDTQSKPFVLALNQAGFFVRTVIVQAAPHYWISDPIEETGSFSGSLAPRLLRFLETQL